MASDSAGFVLMVYIEENHAVLTDLKAETALFLQLLSLFTAKFTPVVYKTVITSSNVLFESALILTMHPTVSVAGVTEKPVDHAEDSSMPRWIMFPDFRHLGRKCRSGKIVERLHGSLLTCTNRLWKCMGEDTGDHSRKPNDYEGF